MEFREQRNRLQCIVDEGILVARRDMVRVLRDLGHVRYQDMLDDQVKRSGEGMVVSVLANPSSSTIVVNKRLYLNVSNFEYMRLGEADEGGAVLDLVADNRILRLIPVSDALTEQQQVIVGEGLTGHRGPLERLFGESLAEVYLDDDGDDDE